MKSVKVYHYDAFSTKPNKGNPAGVVLDGHETKAGVLPIKLEETSQTLEAMKNMQPKNQLFPTILQEMPRASIHPFCLETYDKHAHMHGRHFSSPFSGMTEEMWRGAGR